MLQTMKLYQILATVYQIIEHLLENYPIFLSLFQIFSLLTAFYPVDMTFLIIQTLSILAVRNLRVFLGFKGRYVKNLLILKLSKYYPEVH